MRITRILQLPIEHYEIGDYIEYSWFRGTVVGTNANKLVQYVRVAEVLRQGPNRCIGSIQPVSFGNGKEIAPPNVRMSDESNNSQLIA